MSIKWLCWFSCFLSVLAGATPLPSWDFEAGAQGWAGSNATITVVAGGRTNSGAQCLHVTMNGSSTYNGAVVTMDGMIANLSGAFAAGTLLEVSAWVRVPDDSTNEVIVNLGLKPNGNNYTYLDSLRTTATNGIRREDGWMRLRCVLPAFRTAWSEDSFDKQNGASYTPTSLYLVVRAQNAGQSFLLDDVAFRRMVPGEFSDYAPPTNSVPGDFLRPDSGANGFRLLDGNGEDVILNGLNLWLYSDATSDPATLVWNYFLYSFDEADLERMAADYGMNVVRLNLDYRWFEKTYNTTNAVSTFKPEGFAWLDRTIQWATKYGLYLILDLHTPPGGYQGAGSSTPAAYFTTPSLRQRTENLWVAIAQRYRHEPQIAAYDLLNEPVPLHNIDWYAEAASLTAAIRQLGGDSNHLVLVEAPFPSDGNGFQVLRISDPADRVLYDNHYYDPYSFVFNTDTNTTYVSNNTNLNDGIFGQLSFVKNETGSYTYDTVARELLPAPYGLTAAAAAALYPGLLTTNDRSISLPLATATNAAPVFVGEYGLKKAVFDRDPAAAAAYVADLTRVLDFYCIGRCWWNYRDPSFGLYTTYASYACVPRLRQAALHDLFASLKTARAAMNLPEDRDGDGLPDLWELANFGNLTAHTGTDDSDGDGFNELSEMMAGTNPGNTGSFFYGGFILNSSIATLTWEAIPARNYVIEQATNLNKSAFEVIGSLRVSQKSKRSFVAPLLTNGSHGEFYRIRVGR